MTRSSALLFSTSPTANCRIVSLTEMGAADDQVGPSWGGDVPEQRVDGLAADAGGEDFGGLARRRGGDAEDHVLPGELRGEISLGGSGSAAIKHGDAAVAGHDQVEQAVAIDVGRGKIGVLVETGERPVATE